MIRSLLDHVPPRRDLLLFIADGGLTEENKRKLLASWDRKRMQVAFVRPDARAVSSLKLSHHIHTAAYFRLLLPEILPPSIRRVLYLDCDLVVRSDISELWETDLRGLPLAAVQELLSPFVSSPRGLLNYRPLGLAPETPYFNSGVMLMDLVQWRNERLGERIIQYIERQERDVRWWDQDGLNAVLAGKWFSLDPRWNVGALEIAFDRGEETPLTREAFDELLRGAAIIHFNSPLKPWNPGYPYARRMFFERAVQRTAWRAPRAVPFPLRKITRLLRSFSPRSGPRHGVTSAR